MIEIKLSDAALKNLVTFLNRVDYKGLGEAQAVVEIVTAINMGQKITEPIENK